MHYLTFYRCYLTLRRHYLTLYRHYLTWYRSYLTCTGATSPCDSHEGHLCLVDVVDQGEADPMQGQVYLLVDALKRILHFLFKAS